MRIATWNLWWKFGPWEARQQPIYDELARVDADIICLQEVVAELDDDVVTRDQAVELAEGLGYSVVRSHEPDGTIQTFGNAVLSRWPVEEQFVLPLPLGEPPAGNRTAVFASVRPSGTDRAWWFVSTHLDWRYDRSELRTEQLSLIAERVAEIRGVDAPDQIPVVLAGDFNAVADAEEIRRLTGLARPYVDGLIFTDAWPAVRPDAGVTWTRANPHAAQAQWPERRLDAVFVAWPRPKPLANPLSAELFGVDGGTSGMVPSDHYGVVVELDERVP